MKHEVINKPSTQNVLRMMFECRTFDEKNEEKSIILNNLPVNHFSLNLGLGLPLSGLSKANLGLEFGKIGDDKNSLVENYVALRLGLSLNDIWFIKRKFN